MIGAVRSPTAAAPQLVDQVALAWIGPWDRGEFAELAARLDPRRAAPRFRTVDEWLATLRPETVPAELLLVANDRLQPPSAEALGEVARRAPLTRPVIVAGVWCEGERRTGRPLPGVARVLWHELLPWAETSAAARAAGGRPAWSLPPWQLAVDPWTEREGPGGLLQGEGAAVGARAEVRRAAVDVLDHASFDALRGALAAMGWEASWLPRQFPERWNGLEAGAPPRAGIWDGGQLADDELAALRRFAGRLGQAGARCLVLVDFPRPEHFAAVRQAGGVAVLGKPYRLAALEWGLEACVATRDATV
jgi:hypothetical protein